MIIQLVIDSINEMQGLLKPLDALMEYTFNGTQDAYSNALGVGSDNPYGDGLQEVKPIDDYPYRCNTHANENEVLEINYCEIQEAVDRVEYTIGNTELSINLKKVEEGLEIVKIKSNDTDLLNASSQLFTLNIAKLSDNSSLNLSSSDGWSKVAVISNGSDANIVFSQPVDNTLPSNLKVTATIKVTNAQSQWDLAVIGLGETHSLMKAATPILLLKSAANDHFFVPKYSGQLIPDPLANNINYEMLYPRGWSTSMQFLAYYNDNYGIYLGFHDPKASTKKFIIEVENGSLRFSGEITVPNKTLSANDWELPGVFELDVFNGNWYDAAIIYKKWASAEAEYWPEMTSERVQRQSILGRIGVWGYYSEKYPYSAETMKKEMHDFIDYFSDIPVGIHWYEWNTLDFDNDYPKYFPEREEMSDIVKEIQESGNAYIMPYINGRLYDTDLSDYQTQGYPYATKDTDGNIFSQSFNNNEFAVMCPTQKPWQDTLIDTTKQLTERIGSSGIYIDQVAAATPTECMDPSHNHPLGGGHWWHDGYNQLFKKIYNSIPATKFITVEGGNDYMANQVDGFLTGGWTANNLVPAFQAVYSGRVQLIAKKLSSEEYGNQSFYTKLSQGFVDATQMGRVSLWFTSDPNARTVAAPFVKRLATIRYKLRDFLSFGSLLKPININGNIPDITSTWHDYGEPVDVTVSAIQSAIYYNNDKDAVALIYVNASMTDNLEFSFDFDGSLYGFEGQQLKLQEITEIEEQQEEQGVNNSFSKTVQLAPLAAVAFIIKK